MKMMMMRIMMMLVVARYGRGKYCSHQTLITAGYEVSALHWSFWSSSLSWWYDSENWTPIYGHCRHHCRHSFCVKNHTILLLSRGALSSFRRSNVGEWLQQYAAGVTIEPLQPLNVIRFDTDLNRCQSNGTASSNQSQLNCTIDQRWQQRWWCSLWLWE